MGKSITHIAIWLMLMLAACSNQEDASMLQKKPQTLAVHPSVLVSHRGAWDGTGFAENTLNAILCSRDRGFVNVEIDLHITRDSVIVLSHESQICGFDIKDYSYFKLYNYAKRYGVEITKFSEVLDLMRQDEQLTILAEIKDVDIGVLHDMVSRYGMNDRIIFISFDRKYTDQLIKLGYDCGYLGGILEPAWLHDRGYRFMDYHYTILLDNPQWIAEAKRLGLLVGAFTVDDLDMIHQLHSMGVDLITTNLTLDTK